MHGFRITVLVLLFGGVSLALAGVRMEQARCVARIQQHHFTHKTLMIALHKSELQIARLRSPQLIIDRVERMRLLVQAPEELELQTDSSVPSTLALANE